MRLRTIVLGINEECAVDLETLQKKLNKLCFDIYCITLHKFPKEY